MTNLELVRKAIVAAVPEIMELKFGCVVRHTPPKQLGIDYRGIYIHEGKASKWRVNQRILFPAMGSEPAYSLLLSSDDIEIIGRPIQLHDVLRACKAKRKSLFLTDDERIRTDLEGTGVEVSRWDAAFEGAGVENELEFFWYHWNLALPLNEQEQAVIDFLANILCHD